jgi:hypothetical protein
VRHTGQFALAAVILLPVLGIALGTLGKARRAFGPQGKKGKGRGGVVSGWLQHRRALRLERVRHENASARDNAKHEHRLAEQEAARKARAADGDDGGDSPRRSRGGTVRGKVVRLGDDPAAEPGTGKPKPGDPPAAPPASSAPKPPGPSDSPGPPGPSPSAAPGAPPQPAAPARTAAPQQPPARAGSDPRPAPGQPQSPTLEGVVMTDNPAALSVPGVEQIIEGANAVRRYMLSGNARAKQRGLLGIGAAEDALARTVRALARDMAEPGQHYGPEITDPLAMSAVHLGAASMALAEIQGRLRAIIRASEELAAAGVQAPHHAEFDERGLYERGGSVGTAPPNSYVDSSAVKTR